MDLPVDIRHIRGEDVAYLARPQWTAYVATGLRRRGSSAPFCTGEMQLIFGDHPDLGCSARPEHTGQEYIAVRHTHTGQD